MKKSERIIYEPLQEIKHVFRSPEPRPPQLISDAFTALCAFPMLLLLILVGYSVFIALRTDFSGFVSALILETSDFRYGRSVSMLGLRQSSVFTSSSGSNWTCSPRWSIWPLSAFRRSSVAIDFFEAWPKVESELFLNLQPFNLGRKPNEWIAQSTVILFI